MVISSYVVIQNINLTYHCVLRNKSLKIAWEKSDKKKSVYEKKWKHWSLQRDLRHMNDPATGKVIQGPMRQASGNWPWGLSFVIVMDDDEDTACPQFDSSGTRVLFSDFIYFCL